MLKAIIDVYQIDWRIFMAGAETWLGGQNPYAQLSSSFGTFGPGAFAYPPTALAWLALFVPLGGLGYFVWTGLELLLWWMLIQKDRRSQLLLLCWAPMWLHVIEGQSTFMAILALWAAARAPRRGWLWGLAIAWALTKPQAAIAPVVWLLWQDRLSPTRARLWGGIILGTSLLALPATLMHPGIWADWLASLPAYRERILQMAAWQGPSIILFGLAAYLWLRSRQSGWQWWLAAGAFPQTSFYSMVALTPTLRPRPNYWMLAGLGLSNLMLGPMRFELADGRVVILLPWLLAGHLLATWMIARSAGAPAAPATVARRLAPAEE